MTICEHSYEPAQQPGYEVCKTCGTYHSMAALPPEQIYATDYWSPKWGHNTLRDHQHNVDVHKENGLTKNEYVLRIIADELLLPGGRDSVMEIACAPGNLMRRLRETAGFKRIVGVEVDPVYEPEMRQIAGDCELIFGYFPEATRSVPSDSFDLIVGLDIFEHAHDPGKFLDECNRLLRPHGQLILMAPVVSAMLDPRFFHTVEHVFIHSISHIRKLLARSGFSHPTWGQWTTGHETFSATKLI